MSSGRGSIKQVFALSAPVSPAKSEPYDPTSDLGSGIPFHGTLEFQPVSHQVILRIKVILGNEHRCESFHLSGADRTQLNTKLAIKTPGILLGSMFLSVRPRPNPEVSFLVYQQIAEGYPSDFRR